ncbi:MAG: AAA family ATPase [Plesiomonas sp.]
MFSLQQGERLNSRVSRLNHHLCEGVYERQNAFKLSLLAALSGESVFLLGPPGIGKSLIAKRLMYAFNEASTFEYLMTRFSTPEEVFGPLSILALKEQGLYVRLTEGYLPAAHIVFLDEIWKASPAILNTLLTVLNEKLFRNGTQMLKLPMRLLITASNELPDPHGGLDPFYDRMLLRVYVGKVEQKDNFRSMVVAADDVYRDPVPADLKISEQEYLAWQQQIPLVDLPDSCFEKIYYIKTQLEEKQQQDPEIDLYISDRRWKKSIHLLRACAFFNGRAQITPTDLLILVNCLWRDLPTREFVRTLISDYAENMAYDQHEFREQIAHLHDQIVHQLATRMAAVWPLLIKSNGLRGERYQLDLSQAAEFRHMAHKGLIRLIPLVADPVLTRANPEPAYQLLLDPTELQKLLAKGLGTVPVFINTQTSSQHVSFALDSQMQLVVRDNANHDVPLGISGIWPVSAQTEQQWQTALTSLEQQQQTLMQRLQVQRDQFLKTVPHHFADQLFIDQIQRSLDQLLCDLDQVKNGIQGIEATYQRIKHHAGA